MAKKESSNKEAPQMKNADALIVKDEQAKLGKVVPPTPEPQPEVKEIESSKAEKAPEETKLEKASNEEKVEGATEVKPEESSTQSKPESDLDSSQDASKDQANDQNNEVDDYGTKVGKPKMYTEEEVNRMMRERFKRGNHGEQPNQQQQQTLQNAAKDFTPDPNSADSWELQLEQFIEATNEKLARKRIEKEWKQKEEQSQADFEIKFTQGMGKYSDFQNVVANKPITEAMMLATRSMKDPAAFIYAACKQRPEELAAIAKMADPLAQAVEMGKLEERMKKARTLPSAPTPAKVITSDTSREAPELSIDARIASYAKDKIMRFR